MSHLNLIIVVGSAASRATAAMATDTSPTQAQAGALDHTEQQHFSIGVLLRHGGVLGQGSRPDLSLCSPDFTPVGPPTQYGRTHIELVADFVFVHWPTRRSCMDNLFVSLLFEKVGRFRFPFLGR